MTNRFNLLSIAFTIAACGGNEASIVTPEPATGGDANSITMTTSGGTQVSVPNGGSSEAPMNTGGSLSVSTATGGTMPSTCVVGTVGCACYPTDTCNAGAQCFLGACLMADGSTGGASTSGGASNMPAPTGGTSAVSTSSPTGGTIATGGAKATGGSAATGGSIATVGGAPSTGGSPGVSSTGGSPGTGGNMATGGSIATGGSSTAALCGQSVCVAGQQTCEMAVCPYPPGTCVSGYVCWPPIGTGGSSSTGGAPSTGGAKSTGGSLSTGGRKATGGSPATGGTTAAVYSVTSTTSTAYCKSANDLVVWSSCFLSTCNGSAQFHNAVLINATSTHPQGVSCPPVTTPVQVDCGGLGNTTPFSGPTTASIECQACNNFSSYTQCASLCGACSATPTANECTACLASCASANC